MNLINANTNNLIALWKQAASPFQSYFEEKELGYCFIENSQWPNRVWLQGALTEETLAQISQLIGKHQQLTFSYFDTTNGTQLNWLKDKHFSEKSLQYGMALKLEQDYNQSDRVSLQRVQTKAAISSWCKVFKQAFNYEISEETLEQTFRAIPYFTIIYQQQVVGSLILYQTKQVTGFHSLGIIPEVRGKGLAQEAMNSGLHLAQSWQSEYVTLQASPMAKTMYENLGFSTQFIMRNYNWLIA